MTFRRDVLPESQQDVLGLLGPVLAARDFYLAGETAVALHLGHRRSIDLDWFREQPVEDPLALAGELREDGVSLEVGSVAPGTLHGTVSGVRISLLVYRYPLLDPPLAWDEMGCRVAAMRDLAAMKLAAAAQRRSRKDLVDLAALLEHLSLDDMLDAYRRRYGIPDATHVLYGLTYFDDAESEPPPYMLVDLGWAEVKRRLTEAVAAFATPR